MIKNDLTEIHIKCPGCKKTIHVELSNKNENEYYSIACFHCSDIFLICKQKDSAEIWRHLESVKLKKIEREYKRRALSRSSYPSSPLS